MQRGGTDTGRAHSLSAQQTSKQMHELAQPGALSPRLGHECGQKLHSRRRSGEAQLRSETGETQQVEHAVAARNKTKSNTAKEKNVTEDQRRWCTCVDRSPVLFIGECKLDRIHDVGSSGQ
jgi:hypothetical protein